MLAEKAALVLNTILKRTEEGKMQWTATSTDDAFEVSFPRETLRIVHEEGVDRDSGEEYSYHYLDILNPEGRPIDSIKPYDVRNHFTDPNAWKVTSIIFAHARDIALGVSEIADDILTNLGGAVPLDNLDEEIPF